MVPHQPDWNYHYYVVTADSNAMIYLRVFTLQISLAVRSKKYLYEKILPFLSKPYENVLCTKPT